jgi:hypothetical protein
VLASRVVAALFRSRGWRTGEVCQKRLSAFGLIAAFEFTGMGHFFTELESIESGRIFFVGLDSRQLRDPASWVPLQEVPPLAFSETMRDADLAVSVAQRGDEGYFSAEMYQNRADVIRALVEQLSIDGVSVEEHFVRVEGKRAVYRIHLGSSNVFIEPGHHICIVPERRVAAAEEIYLPFSDTADRKAAELVSKLILLANDDRIEDPSILSQIENARQR